MSQVRRRCVLVSIVAHAADDRPVFRRLALAPSKLCILKKGWRVDGRMGGGIWRRLLGWPRGAACGPATPSPGLWTHTSSSFRVTFCYVVTHRDPLD